VKPGLRVVLFFPAAEKSSHPNRQPSI